MDGDKEREHQPPTNNLNDDSETAETLQVDEEPLAIGQVQVQLRESNIEIEVDNDQPTRQRTSRGRIDGKEICTCTKDRTVATRQANACETVYCHLCGKITAQSTETHVHNGSLGLSSPPEGHDRMFADGSPVLPGTCERFLEGNNVSTGRSAENTTSQIVPTSVAEGRVKTPLHGTCANSVQVPCRGRNFTFYTLVEDHPAVNEKWFSVYFVPSQRYEEETIRTLEDLDGDIRNAVPIGNEYLSLQENRHFHTAFIDNNMHLTINFQLLEQCHGTFRIRGAQTAVRMPLHRILSLSQDRILGATARVFVQCLGLPRELCQAHIRMTLKYGDTVKKMLIPIWSAVVNDIQDDPSTRKSFLAFQ